MQRALVYLAILSVTTLSLPGIVIAAQQDEAIFDSRYVAVRVKPEEGQLDLLKSILDLEIPARIHTVGQAVEYLLNPYGFRLAACESGTEEQAVLLMLSLPTPHRKFGPVTLVDALSMLGGEGYVLSINPVKRSVCYHLRDDYQRFVNQFDVDQAMEQWRALKESLAVIVDEGEQTQHESSQTRIYGPVTQGESLSSIAIQMEVDAITRDQTFVRLFYANPQAFINKNMNGLLAGATLVIPSFEYTSLMPVKEASELVDEHYRAWITRKLLP